MDISHEEVQRLAAEVDAICERARISAERDVAAFIASARESARREIKMRDAQQANNLDKLIAIVSVVLIAIGFFVWWMR